MEQKSDFKYMYRQCALCARRCGVDRASGNAGYCRMGDVAVVSRAALHFWEEPPISGTRGSGTIFFSGCSLGCVYCQNREISRGDVGVPADSERLSEIMLDLKKQGAHNINLVTPTHFIPSIAEAIDLARDKGLDLPIVYNTGGYDSLDGLRAMEGRVDVYLPDMKYYRAESGARLSSVPDYPDRCREAIAEMVRQVGAPAFDGDIMVKGVIVRLLLLPSHLAEAKLNLKYLFSTYGDSIYISLMNQYTPMPEMKSPLDRKVSSAEYNELVDYALRLGVKNAFIQEGGTQSESFIPPFDLTGVR